MKKIGIIILIIVIVGIFVRDFVIKQVIVSVGSSVVGAPLKVGEFSLSLLRRSMRMTDVTLFNPPGFTSSPLIDIAHININFYPMALLSGKLYFSLIDVDIRKMAIERNKKGELNAASLKIKPQKSDKPLDMRIDILKINVDDVTFFEANNGGQPQEINRAQVLRNRTFKNVTSPQQLVALILFDSSGISALKGIAMDTTKEVLNLTHGVTDRAENAVKSVLGTFKAVIDK